MPKGIRQEQKLKEKGNLKGTKFTISRQKVEYSMRKFHHKVSKRQYLCMITEWDCPSLVSKEKFKEEYLDPLKRSVDQYLSAVVHWRELDLGLVTLEEYIDVQALWLRVDQYIKKQQ